MTGRFSRVARARAVVAKVVALTAAMALAACTPASEQAAPPGVVVIGDQASTAVVGPSWPQLLEADDGIRATVDAVADSGYLTASPGSVGDRVAAQSGRVVVIALGAADLTRGAQDEALASAVAQGVGAAVGSGAQVLVLSPLVPGGGGPQADVIARAAREAGAQYVDVALPPDPSLIGDGGTLSPDGSRFVAHAVQPFLVGQEH